MSDEEKLELLRRRRLQEMQQAAAQQQVAAQQQQDFSKKKYEAMRKILSQEGRQRLENIRMVKPQFAEQIELQLIQLVQSGKLRGAIPLSDNNFKKILEQLTASSTKKDYKIKKI